MTGSLSTQETIYVAVGGFVDELVRSGIHHFCVAPGSRSTPLAMMIDAHPEARLWMHLDERSCGFFGLGLAKARGEPVVLACTSGTAAANFLPAVVEAHYARVPLVVLTADRPHELRDVGAPQTIDQVRLYGSHAKWFVDMEEPPNHVTPDLYRHLRSVAARTAATARRAPAGPVHVNWPFREPLVPTPVELPAEWQGRAGGAPYVEVTSGTLTLGGADIEILAELLRGRPRGLIVCGPQDDPGFPPAVASLAEALELPVLADPLSGARTGSHPRRLVIDAYDAFLRDTDLAARLTPEVIIRFGSMPTSKPLLQYFERHSDVRHLVVDGGAGWDEPTGLATQMIQADGRQLCEVLRSRLPVEPGATSEWADSWVRANHAARHAIRQHLTETEELFEGRVFAELADLLPDGATLYAGNSMPVRDMDTFVPGGERAIRFLSNRGANGIDGVVSSALGACVDAKGPVVLAIGDISFYHDSNGLLAANRHGLDMTVVLLNNNGGGIFSFLPQESQAPDQFERLFGTPHGLRFGSLAETYGATYTCVERWTDFRTAVERGMREGGLHVVEVPTDRARNVAQHRAVWPVVARAVDGALSTACPTAG